MTIRPIRLPLPGDLTHHEALICMWIGSDPPLLKEMRSIAEGDEFEWGDYDLSEAVINMLYDPAYGKAVTDLTRVPRYGGDEQKARVVRSFVPEDSLTGIEADGWARIRGALLA